MLISLEKRFIFIANTKTGSTSIERALAPYADIRHDGTPERKHVGIRDVLKECRSVFEQPGTGPETFLKFGVMRDPVDWIYSWFRYRKRRGARNPLPIDMTFEEFWERRDWTFQNKKGQKNLQKNRFISQDGDILMDRIIPYPELATGFAEICENLGLEVTLPRTNVSEIKPTKKPIAPSLLREVEQFFSEDYDLYHRLPELNARPAQASHKVATPSRPLGPEIDYMFLFAPNNSGSTIMSQYIASQVDGYLPPYGNNEGQNLPELRKIMKPHRWTRTFSGRWKRIRQVFDTYRNGAIFVEASPPNIARVGTIRKNFDGSAKYLFSICNPYQSIASSVFNYGEPPIEPEIERVSTRWLERAAMIRQAMADNPDIPFLNYETFCDDPSSFNRLFGLDPVPYAPLQGKKVTQMSEIRNLSARTISFLSESEIDLVTEQLTRRRDLVEFFGYRLESGAEMLASFAGKDEDIAAGRHRRAKWQA